MRLYCTVETGLQEDIIELKEEIEVKPKWEAQDFSCVLRRIQQLEKEVAFRYFKKAGQFLKESGRQVYEGTFTGDVDLLISYTNAILILNKLKHIVLKLQRTPMARNEHL